MKKLFVIVFLFLIPIKANATIYFVYSTKLYVYAQSKDESEANLVRSVRGKGYLQWRRTSLVWQQILYRFC